MTTNALTSSESTPLDPQISGCVNVGERDTWKQSDAPDRRSHSHGTTCILVSISGGMAKKKQVPYVVARIKQSNMAEEQEGDHELLVGGGIEVVEADDEDNMSVNEVHLIQDLEGWLRMNGLRGPDDDQPAQGDFDVAQQRQRLEEESSYERQVHEIMFGDALREDERRQQTRRDFLDSIQELQIDLITADGPLAGISLQKLAERCDTIYTLAGTWQNFSNNKHNIHFSLDGYAKDTVQEFLTVLLDDSKTATDISAESIVDCCCLAHYLCADQLLTDITEVLIQSIDTSNCLTLCQLGDRLNLPVLFERSLAHLMDTIGDLERADTWDDLTPELRDRITTIKSAIESSVNSQSRL